MFADDRAQGSARSVRTLAPITTGALFIAAAVVVGSFLTVSARDGTFAIDLRHALLPAADHVLHGHTPYPRASQLSATDQTAYVYPPLAAVLLAPVSWLPSLAVAVGVVVLLASTVAATLRLLGVRDPRCYAAAFLWGPTLAALQTANLTPFLALAAAAAWAYRGSARGAVALVAAFAPKVFLWPLAVWALAMHRTRTVVAGITGALAVTFAAWAVVGFAGLGAYPHLLRRLQSLEERDSYSVFALARALGARDGLARALWLAVGLAAIAACVELARRGDDRRAFTLAIVASLLLTPIVWLHYFVLLVVPLAVARPTLDWAWVLPVVLIVGGSGTGNGGVARTILVLGVATVVTAASIAPSFSPRSLYAFGRRKTTTDELL
jgi:alpha-1,2-mannosyltransferase